MREQLLQIYPDGIADVHASSGNFGCFVLFAVIEMPCFPIASRFVNTVSGVGTSYGRRYRCGRNAKVCYTYIECRTQSLRTVSLLWRLQPD